MTPDFRIVANGSNVTATLRDRLVSLQVTDEDGDKADRIELVVDNRDDLVELPEMDAMLEVWLGSIEGGLTMMGRYAVDGRGGEGPVQLLLVRATAADMKGGIRAPRTRAWEDKTLSDIVQTIAGEAGLKAVVSEAIASTSWRYLAQTAESNLHFLRRIASTLNATAKPSGGALIVGRRGDDNTAAGDPMPDPTLSRADLVSWSWQDEGRERAGRIEAEWGDPDRGLRELVTLGDSEPVIRLRHLHSSEEEARRACSAEREKRARGEITMTAELARFTPDLVAGARMTFSGVTSKIDGQWNVVRVVHTLADGLRTEVEARRGGQQ